MEIKGPWNNIYIIFFWWYLVANETLNAESKSQNEHPESIKRQFTYSEVQRITNNFERTLGKGGFGTVYHGFIDENTQVAVKKLSASSTQGYQQFQAEARFLRSQANIIADNAELLCQCYLIICISYFDYRLITLWKFIMEIWPASSVIVTREPTWRLSTSSWRMAT